MAGVMASRILAVALPDLRIATDTTLDCHNLDWYAIRRSFTPFELCKESTRLNSKWNKKLI